MSYGLSNPNQAAQAPVCPRHPDRISYVTCQRCSRPACPECQVTAAVGTQCVDCVREANKQIPGTRTVFGGKATDGRPIVTYVLIAINAVVFALQMTIPSFTNHLVYAGLYTSGYFEPEPWRMITSIFAHSTSFIGHIAFNMYALYICGRVLEPMLGRLRFLALYLVAGLGGSVAVLLITDPRVPVLGASGAVFGLFAAMFVLLRSRGVQSMQIVILIVINLAIGFIFPGIAWEAHVGGMVLGAAVAAVMAYSPKGPRQAAMQWAGTTLLVLLLVALTLYGAVNVRVG
ncbi:rhomboid family intramembrane serine protease [Paeniglutamicibacter psychrophenolicus]|uniref:rhomboid family intramembrane serine protease n=1 Tax=Paeniglutamicibacter psychrophenolicus TaxID=257454 RepID=UPI00278B1B35|nr:rhomboid family intramembrane serine protease [Paeniglutamicibacter psychrophenolicus]MDQ0095086.1 membrane associated rhomboid family serine protease [Paeniglutamicibacter psychrophenolicus]